MNLNSLSLSFGASIWGAYAWWHCPFLMANTGWGGGACNHSVLPSLTANSSHLSVLAEIGWRAEFLPADHSLSEFEFDVIIGADGRRNTLEGDDSS